MPLDTRALLSAAPGYVPPLDPAQVVGRGMGLAQTYQQTQAGALQLAEAQRQEQERGTMARAFQKNVVTDPVTGQTRVNIPGAFTEAYRTTSDPLTVFKAQQSYEKQQAASAKDTLEARKTQLETLEKQTGFVSQLANGVLAVEAQGGDVETAYQRAIQQAAQVLGPDQLRGLPPTYDGATVRQFAATGQTYNEQIKNQLEQNSQQLRAAEVAETQKRTAIEREGLGIRREDVAARREETAQRREGTQQQRLGEREEGLRKEFTALTKDYRTVADAYGRIQSAQETGPGDISLIFGFMKLLDPGSTVREGEFATAQNAGGVPERVIAQYNRLISGERLAPETRRQFLAQAQGHYDQATKDYERTRGQYQDLARRSGVDPGNVTLEMGSTAPPRTGARAPASGETRRTGGGRSPYADIPVDKLTPQQMDEEEAWLLQQPGMR